MKRHLLIATVLMLLAAPLFAHHSTAMYDMANPVTITGTVTRFEWTNPHAFVYLDVKDDKGNVVNWACEGGGPGALSRRGFKRGDIKIGDKMIVDGYRAKDGSHLMDARRVTLPDGRRLYGGSAGDGGPGEN